MIWIGVVVGAVLVGALVTVVAGRTGSLAPLPSSRRDVLVPAEGPLTAEDLRGVRFSWAWRGYARDEVDALLARLEEDARGREAPVPTPAEPGPAEANPAEPARPEPATDDGADE